MPVLTRMFAIATLAIFTAVDVRAQRNETDIHQYLEAHAGTVSREIASFYLASNYTWVWIIPSRKSTRMFISELQTAESFALNTADYDLAFVRQIASGGFKMEDAADSLAAELRITGVAMDFYRDLLYGNNAPPFRYRGLAVEVNYTLVANRLWLYLAKGNLPQLATDLNARIPEINILAIKLAKLQKIAGHIEFRDVKVVSKLASPDNRQLLERLRQTGILDPAILTLPPGALENALIGSQKEYGVIADGKIRTTYLEALNAPLKKRIYQLVVSINYYRWLAAYAELQSLVVVNIPAAGLKVYTNGKVTLQMRVVTGKASTPTPTLTSKITELILYPYWHVPYKIATRELLPRIKANHGFLNQGDYQVLNKRGKLVDPQTVNWSSLSAKNFPYLLRQGTGFDNSLGILKLNFYNPFAVYLHDTPGKSAFMLERRFLSHGCIRMEQPFDLARLLLPQNHLAIDTINTNEKYQAKRPVTIKTDVILPIVVWYNPVGIGQEDALIYYEDVYHRFNL